MLVISLTFVKWIQVELAAVKTGDVRFQAYAMIVLGIVKFPWEVNKLTLHCKINHNLTGPILFKDLNPPTCRPDIELPMHKWHRKAHHTNTLNNTLKKILCLSSSAKLHQSVFQRTENVHMSIPPLKTIHYDFWETNRPTYGIPIFIKSWHIICCLWLNSIQ